MEAPKNSSPTVSSRIRELMEVHKATAYKACKDSGIPEGTFSRSIKTPDTWKVQHLRKLAKYFKVTLDYLITGNSNFVNEDLLIKYNALQEEVMTLREQVATYETVAKTIMKESKSSKLKEKK